MKKSPFVLERRHLPAVGRRFSRQAPETTRAAIQSRAGGLFLRGSQKFGVASGEEALTLPGLDVANAEIFWCHGVGHPGQPLTGAGSGGGLCGVYGKHRGSQCIHIGVPGAEPVSPFAG